MKQDRQGTGDRLDPCGASLRGMVWGWSVMNTLLLGTLALWSAVESAGGGAYPYFFLIALYFGF